jgi:restriction system protein
LWESDAGEVGHQLSTPIGRIDFLCRDTATGDLVVVELKRGRPSDRVVGQTAQYMGWARAHLADEGQAVQGLIIAHEQDRQLSYAVSVIPDLSILTCNVESELSTPHQPQHD